MNICIITQAHLCHNPRVLKEARALSDAGYQVSVIHCTYDKSLVEQDAQLIKNKSIKLIALARLEEKSAANFVYRSARKIAGMLVQKIGLQTSLALGYASWRYTSTALRQNADLYICHQEMGLFCGVKLLKRGRRVGFDFEDWYSEDLLEEAKKKRPLKLLRKLEKFALSRGAFCLAASASMSQSLANRYGCSPPEVIYNVFEFDERVFQNTKLLSNPLKLLWFSQTIGPGRGLEEFLLLMSKMNTPVEIHLLGKVSAPVRSALLRLQSPGHTVIFHSMVPAARLPEKIAEFDVGLALEQHSPLNRELTVTNKFFQYLLSGLPVIASSTNGQLEFGTVDFPGFMLNRDHRDSNTAKLDAWLNDPYAIGAARIRAAEFVKRYNWQSESEKLLSIIRHGLSM